MTTKNITDENFEKEVLQSAKPTVVDFGQSGAALVSKLALSLKKFQMK